MIDRSGFNGAATFRSRKLTTVGLGRVIGWPLRLQWGRDLSVTETFVATVAALRSKIRASMGPRPFGHGNLT